MATPWAQRWSMHSGHGARPPRYWNASAPRSSATEPRSGASARRSTAFIAHPAPRGRRLLRFVALSSDLCRTLPSKHHGRVRASRPSVATEVRRAERRAPEWRRRRPGQGRRSGSPCGRGRCSSSASRSPPSSPAPVGRGDASPRRQAVLPSPSRRATSSRSCGAPRSSSPTPGRSGAGRCPSPSGGSIPRRRSSSFHGRRGRPAPAAPWSPDPSTARKPASPRSTSPSWTRSAPGSRPSATSGSRSMPSVSRPSICNASSASSTPPRSR